MPDENDGTAPGIELGETVAGETMASPPAAEVDMAELVGASG
ncbi:MAG: hypothetical protein RLZZ246_1000, partial [Planctomycetota bacterium]